MKIGDTVSLLDDALEGKIIAINGDRITFKSEDGFELEFPKNELVVVSKELKNHQNFFPTQEVLNEKNSFKKKKQVTVRPKERNLPVMEIDLHLHQLVKNERGMTSYDKLNLQLETAKRQLDFARQKRIQKIVFIHGIGEGVLKSELEYLFKKQEDLKFYEADYQKYGQGALEVYIYQNKR